MIEERNQKQRSLYEQALAEIIEEAIGDEIYWLTEDGYTKADVIASAVWAIRDGSMLLRWKWDRRRRRHTPWYEWAQFQILANDVLWIVLISPGHYDSTPRHQPLLEVSVGDVLERALGIEP